MNLIPHSNGIKRLRIRKKIPISAIMKFLIYSLITILLMGLVFQFAVTKVYNEKYKPRTKYTRINDNRVYYNSIGSGDMTVIFDGDLGVDSNEWNTITREVADSLGVRVFTYNRMGYGFSDGGEGLDPQRQAEDLRLLLNKAGISGPYVLVGAGYGSLIMTNFANTYGDLVNSMVLIDPIVESNLDNEEYISNYIKIKKNSKLETTQSYFGLTYIKYKLGMLEIPENLFSEGQTELKNEFISNRIRSKYPSAMHNEASNILEKKSNSQKEGLIENSPLAIISRNKNVELDKSLLTLSTSRYINQLVTESNGQMIPVEDKNKVLEAIKYAVEKGRVKR